MGKEYRIMRQLQLDKISPRIKTQAKTLLKNSFSINSVARIVDIPYYLVEMLKKELVRK